MAQILDGKLVSASIRAELKTEIEQLKQKGIVPGLAVILVGEDPGSQVYVRNKAKACDEVGIKSEVIKYPEDVSEEVVLEKIKELNTREDIHGILVQLPLPKHIDGNKVIEAIDVKKDVDAFSYENTGHVMIGDYKMLPCTPAGIIDILKFYNIDICGQNCVIIGRSNIVGKPAAMLMMHENATVTVCHTKTRNLSEITSRADILIVSMKKARYITKEYVKDGAIIIDVGMNRDSEGKLCGDVDFDDVFDKCSYITPVPGGVGPMTITTLLKNTLASCKIINNI